MTTDSWVPPSETVVNLLRPQAERHRDMVAFDYSTGAERRSQLGYHHPDNKARAITPALRRQGAAGEGGLVLRPSGLDFIAALFRVRLPRSRRDPLERDRLSIDVG